MALKTKKPAAKTSAAKKFAAKPSQRFTAEELERMGRDYARLAPNGTLDGGKQAMADLICTGLESGYIASFGILSDEYVAPLPSDLFRERSGDDTLYRHIHYPMSVGGAAMLFARHEEPGSPEAEERHRLDLPALYRGVAILALNYPRIFGDWISGNDDALTGDAFLQCALLGEIVYG